METIKKEINRLAEKERKLVTLQKQVRTSEQYMDIERGELSEVREQLAFYNNVYTTWLYTESGHFSHRIIERNL